MNDIMSQRLEALESKNNQAFLEFQGAFKSGNAKKGDILVSHGSICDQLYVLQKGIAKQYRYKEDGTEHITWFNFENDLVTAYTSFVTQKTSKEEIAVIEDCEYIHISRENCYRLAAKYHAVETFFREMLEIYFIQSDERLFFLQALSATQKYDYVLHNMPHFIQKLPQKELSSFLGITRETLSRIRKKVSL
ncbi:Crp/Fnr family transcriptional regulator [uncultured Dokdonia sp.]|uniref:Crp/Fnr family transcriptional regulator n=1 Tax=uncultured Dokdonia sp. TaxID=575653 RepID=UPI002618CC16|nr:Crp/Fnr family transcriptional regulator [uncultured Dokdonia sp.]